MRRFRCRGNDPGPGREQRRFPPAGAVSVVERGAKGGSQRCRTMADQLYLENIDEFVTDQNKIVSSYYWGTRACDRGPGPGWGGGSLDSLCGGFVGSRGRQVPTRGPGRALCPRASEDSSGRSSGTHGSPCPLGGRALNRAWGWSRGDRARREGRWLSISKASLHLSFKVVGV